MRAKASWTDFPMAAAAIAVTVGLATVGWWLVAAGGRFHSVPGFVAITAFSFSLGCLLGFFIGSTEEEKEGVGKIRDVILGGITGAALVSLHGKATEAYRFLEQFAPTVGGSARPVDVASVIGMATAYSVFGFILGYLNREFWLNPRIRDIRRVAALAKKVEATTSATDSVENVGTKATAAEQLEIAATPETKEVASIVADRALTPQEIPASALVPTAKALYRSGKYDEAIRYYRQALNTVPDDAEAGIGLATALGRRGQHREAVSVLRSMIDQGVGLPLAYKLVGYHMLWVPELLQESPRFTVEYQKQVPADSGAYLNLACAYAQLYGRTGQSHMRDLAIGELRRSVQRDPKWKKRARELAQQDFASISDDPEFVELTTEEIVLPPKV